MKKIFLRYGGAILFACFVGTKIGRYAADQEYDFAITFAIWVISAFVEGWLTHALHINPKISRLRKDNIELMSDNMELRAMIREEREKNVTERSEKDSRRLCVQHHSRWS